MLNLGKRLFDTEDNLLTFLISIMLGMILLLGSLSILNKVPWSWMDKQMHYFRSIQIVNGDIIVSDNGNMAMMGGQVSESQNDFFEYWRAQGIAKEQAILRGWWNYGPEFEYSDETRFVANTKSVPYTPITYLPYSVVAWLNKSLKLPPKTEYLLMKIVGFITAFSLLIVILRLAPFGKLTMGILAMHPSTIGAMTAITADMLSTMFAWLFIIYSLRIFYKGLKQEKINWRDLSLYGGITLVMSMMKVPTFFLLAVYIGVMAFLWSRKVLRWSEKSILLSVLGISLFTSLIWILLVKDVNTGAYFGRHVSTSEQLSHIVSHPIDFIATFGRTLLSYKYVSIQIGYSNDMSYSIPIFLRCLYFIALGLSVLVQAPNIKKYLSKNPWLSYYKKGSILLYLGIFLTIFVILYLQFSEIGQNRIDGVQQRYFLPFLPLVLLVAPRRRFSTFLPPILITFFGMVPLLIHLTIIISQN